ncbi:MAG: acyltransferase family protein [Alphaproteobacteria bacterium]|nr:acyltransferase family protein [Alphaproteobacteria bacterium]
MAVTLDMSLVPAPASDAALVSRPALERRPQIPALTGLRFFAAFFILFAHACDWIAQFQNSEINRSFAFIAMYGMPLFFVLSGFVIHYNYRSLFLGASAARATCEFAAARFARLYPLYFCFFLFALGADSFVRTAAAVPHLGTPVIAYYLTLTQSWWYLIYQSRSIIYQLFSVSWSISTEMYFYLLYAVLVFFIIYLSRRARAIVLGTIYALVVTASLWWLRYHLNGVLATAQHFLPDYIPLDNFEHSFFRWLFYFSPYIRVLEFFMGCFAAQAYAERLNMQVSVREHRLGSLALLAALLFLIVVGLLYQAVFNLPIINAYVQFYALNFLCAPAIAVIMFCVCRYDTAFARFMSLPWLVALGEMSYSIYLVHTWTLRLFEQPPQPLTAFWAFDGAFRVACGIALTLLVSYGTYRLIELPGRVWVRASLRRLIRRVFDRDAAHERPSANAASHSKKLVYVGPLIAVLAVFAIGGQAARYDYVRAQARRLVLGDRPEIEVVSATYGGNCMNFPVPAPYPNLAAAGNATDPVRDVCNGRLSCDFKVESETLHDPANGCGKDFAVQYRCRGETGVHSALIAAEALGHHATLSCQRDTP